MSEEKSTLGARTDSGQDREQAARAVQEMFGAIAPDYDRLNHLLSMKIDSWWWRRASRRFDAILRKPAVRVLDLCCGTGDMSFALQRRAGRDGAKITGADFAAPMLERARIKARQRGLSEMQWVEADALAMPFADASFELVTSAFGFRNLADYPAGLAEIARVLAAGGEIGILDFGMPKGLFGALYRFYFRRLLPRVGALVSGKFDAYAYLPASVERFPAPEEMLRLMREAGFVEATYTPYTFGVAGLYWGKKA